MDYYSFRDGRLSWPSWLTHSGRLTHEVVTRQPWIRRRSGKVRQLQTDVLTTKPRRQLNPSSSCCCRLLSCTLNRDLSTVLRFGDSMITSLSSVAATWACKELDVAFMSQFMFVFISPTAVRAMAVATLPSVLRLTVTHNTIAGGDPACFALHTLKLLTTL